METSDPHPNFPLMNSANFKSILRVLIVIAVAVILYKKCTTSEPPPMIEEAVVEQKTKQVDTKPTPPKEKPKGNSCFSGAEEASRFLTALAEKMEQDSLPYDASKLQDCSGIFHQVLQHVKSACPDHRYPAPSEARSSRALARWYHDHGNFTTIEDAVAQRNLIRPGMVMFYGRSGKKYSDIDINVLSREVEHVGIVTEVEKNAAGNVVDYVLFHGRQPGVHAQRSFSHPIEPRRAGLPPFGNWNQQWVAVANTISDK